MSLGPFWSYQKFMGRFGCGSLVPVPFWYRPLLSTYMKPSNALQSQKWQLIVISE